MCSSDLQRAQPTLGTELVIPASREVVEDVPLRTEIMENTTLSVESITSIAEVMESVPLSTKEEAVKRHEQQRLEEWKVDVPTIGAIYSNQAPTAYMMGGK